MSNEYPKIILFGDSLVQRSFDPINGLFGTLLANRFQRICDVVARGCSGYTSRSGRIVLPSIFPEHISNVEAFVIFFGTNDNSGAEDPPGNHVPVEEYSENLKEIIKYAEKIGITKDKIILVTPGPYCGEKFIKWCEEIGRTFPKRENEFIKKYVEVCLNISKQQGVDVVNIYEEMMKDEDWPKYLLDGVHYSREGSFLDWPKYLLDGVHYSREGSFLVYNLLMSILEKRINLSEIFLPYWRDINPIHPVDATPELYLQKSKGFYYPVEM